MTTIYSLVYLFLLVGALPFQSDLCSTQLAYHLELEGESLPAEGQTATFALYTMFMIGGNTECSILGIKDVQVHNCVNHLAYYLRPGDRCYAAVCLKRTYTTGHVSSCFCFGVDYE